jgi:hypothetical protein
MLNTYIDNFNDRKKASSRGWFEVDFVACERKVTNDSCLDV